MLKEILKDIDSKTITSAGGIVIALVLAYFLYQLAGVKIDTGLANVANAMTTSAQEDAKLKSDLTQALIRNAAAIEGNTKVMEQVLRQR